MKKAFWVLVLSFFLAGEMGWALAPTSSLSTRRLRRAHIEQAARQDLTARDDSQMDTPARAPERIPGLAHSSSDATLIGTVYAVVAILVFLVVALLMFSKGLTGVGVLFVVLDVLVLVFVISLRFVNDFELGQKERILKELREEPVAERRSAPERSATAARDRAVQRRSIEQWQRDVDRASASDESVAADVAVSEPVREDWLRRADAGSRNVSQLVQAMKLITRAHKGNHNLECGWDAILHWLYVRGVRQSSGEPYRIEHLKLLLEERMRATNPDSLGLALYPQMNNVFFRALISSYVKQAPVNGTSQEEIQRHYGDLRFDPSKDRWSDFLKKVKAVIDEAGMAYIVFDGGQALNAYDVDLAQGVIRTIDPHDQFSLKTRFKRTISLSDVKKPLSLRRYMSLGDEVALERLSADLRRLEEKKFFLAQSLWGEMVLTLERVYAQFSSGQAVSFLRQSEEALGQKPLNKLPSNMTQFYRYLTEQFDSGSLQRDYPELVSLVNSFRSALSAMPKIQSKCATFGGCIQYLMESLPGELKTMHGHFSWIPLASAYWDASGLEREVAELPKVVSRAAVARDFESEREMTNWTDLLGEFANFPELEPMMRALSALSGRVVLVENMSTPARIVTSVDGRKELRINRIMLDGTLDGPMRRYVLLHELLRLSEFTGLPSFEELVEAFVDLDGPNARPGDLVREKELMRREFELYRQLFGDAALTELARSFRVAEQGGVIQGLAVSVGALLDAFAAPEVSSFDQLASEYLKLSIHA